MRRSLFPFFLFFPLALFSSPVPAKIFFVKGNVQAGSEKAGWARALPDQSLAQGFSVRTSAGAEAGILVDGNVVHVDENSLFEMTSADTDKGGAFSFSLLFGRILAQVRKLSRSGQFEVSTPTAVVGVRGTEFSVMSADDGAEVDVYDGRVELRDRADPARKVVLGKDQFVRFGKDRFPAKAEKMDRTRREKGRARLEKLRERRKELKQPEKKEKARKAIKREKEPRRLK